MHLFISKDIVSTKFYDKRDDFDFEIVNFPFLEGDVPCSTSYGVYISQLIRFVRASSHVADFKMVSTLKFSNDISKVSKGAKIRNRYNQVPRLTHDTNRKVTNLQFDTKKESQEGSPFPAGDHKAHINRRSQRHIKHKAEKHKRSTKEVPFWNGQ